MKFYSFFLLLVSILIQSQKNSIAIPKIQIIDGKEIIWKKDNATSISFFNLAKGFSNESKKVINKKLDSIYNSLIKNKLASPNSYDYEYEISYVNDRFLSFKSKIYNQSTGEYGSANSFNYDLKSGKKYEFNELYPKAIIPILLKDEFEKRGSIIDDEYKKYLEENYERMYCFWIVDKKGIIVIIPFSNIAEEKNRTLLIPFDKLKNYKNHNFF